jgi:hypothetical protein
MENGEAVYETGSGKYSFASKNGKTVVEAEAKIK